jgi:hypothetical protein
MALTRDVLAKAEAERARRSDVDRVIQRLGPTSREEPAADEVASEEVVVLGRSSSPEVSSLASQAMRDPEATEREKRLAASVLSQAVKAIEP